MAVEGEVSPNALAVSESLSVEGPLPAREPSMFDMEIEANPGESEPLETTKRSREDEENEDGASAEGGSKKARVETSVEEERLEKMTEGGEAEEEGVEGEEDNDDDEKEGKEESEGRAAEALPVKLGPKKFDSSVEMFDYFFKLLHFWPTNVDINNYEHMVFLDLLKKGCLDAEKKIGCGIRSFQVRYHPVWKSRCFFLVRTDGSTDDFSYRKSIDRILPLPENMKAPPGADIDKKAGSKKSGGHRGGGGGRGRGKFGCGRGRGRN